MKIAVKLIGFCLWCGIAIFSGTLLISASVFLYLSPALPSVDSLRDIRLQTPLRVFSADNRLIAEFGEKRRTPIQYADLPAPLIKAFLAAEDDRFYFHNGVDIIGLLRATMQLVSTGKIQSGGSTITMQVAKNFFLNRERVFSRKFNEILLALEIEKKLSKEEILELYLNKIYLGNRAYGVEAAAQTYYGKFSRELTLAEMAMIAGLPKAPSRYNPLANSSRALMRRNWILSRMHSLGYITSTDKQAAVDQPVTAQYHGLPLSLRLRMSRRWFVRKSWADSGRKPTPTAMRFIPPLTVTIRLQPTRPLTAAFMPMMSVMVIAARKPGSAIHRTPGTRRS